MYLPTAQSSHDVVVPYWPCAHSFTQTVLVAASNPVPEGHTQLDTVVLPAGDVFGGGQGVQASVPVMLLYVPARHSSHAVLTPDVALYLPGSQDWQTLCPSYGVYLPTPQLSHAALTPGNSLCVPGGQSVHVVDPGLEENLPTAHSLQTGRLVM